MAQLACYSTRNIAPRERLARWDAELWAPVVPVNTVSEGVPFVGEANYACLGDVHLFRIAATAHRIECRAASNQGQRQGLAALTVQRRGTATIAQNGREIALHPGSWAICDADRPFTMISDEDGEQLILLMPRERLGIGSGFANYTARNFGATAGTARLLPCYLAGLFDELGDVADGNCGELADMAAQLVRLALFEVRQSTPPISMRETLRLRVKDYVRRNLRDPALSIERVAAAFGCTKRHLHNVFTGDDLTLSQFIWAQRLESCRDALRNPNLARHSITEIAFMWGFNNSAHFSKTFKERFGMPPGSFREQAEGSSLPAPLQVAA